MKILVTGAAGFIGFHLCKKLINSNFQVIGIDNLNSYYDKKLKEARLKVLQDIANKSSGQLFFKKVEIENSEDLKNIFNEFEPEKVIHLAAQAGVRYSIDNPSSS